jgi:hypothetical protein
MDTALDRKVTEIAAAWGPLTLKAAADKAVRARITPMADRFKGFFERTWKKGQARVADVNRAVREVNDAADIAGWTDALNPFAPSDDAKKKVGEVYTKWLELEPKMADSPQVAKELKPQHDFWSAFWKRWQDGDRDIDKINAVVIDVNVARANALKILTQQDKDKVANMDPAKLSSARETATKVDEGVTKLSDDAKKKLDETAKIPSKLIAVGAGLAAAAWLVVKAATKGLFP